MGRDGSNISPEMLIKKSQKRRQLFVYFPKTLEL